MEAERNFHGGPWRCFHCDEEFTTVGAASDHFGPHPASTPGCVIDKILPEGGTNTQRGLGLLMALRRAEAELARYREEDTDLHRALHAKDCERNTAVMRAEEQGYARGLRDGVNLPADSPERAALTGVGDTPLRNGQSMEELEQAEREHFGDPDKGTGVYGVPAAPAQTFPHEPPMKDSP